MRLVRPPSKQPIPTHAKKVYIGQRFEIYQWEQPLYDGTKAIFEKIKRNDTASVIAITPEHKIIITEQEQPGIKPFIGTLGGVVDDGEDAFAAAQRELLEESGYKSDKWELWHSLQPLGKIEWVIYIFIAKDCVKVQEPHHDPGEKIKLKEITFDDFVELCATDYFRDQQLASLVLRKAHKGELEDIKTLFFS